MTIQCLFSKGKALSLLLLICSSAFSGTKVCSTHKDVLIRGKGSRYNFVSKELKGLYCNKGFESDDFKIVFKKDNSPIQFDASPELVRRASNVYYHLMKAKDFWVNEINSDYVKNLDQITIRIQIENSFSRLGHFENDNMAHEHNNAWTVPAGQTPRWADQQDKWGQEIWFSPMKKVESRKLVTSSGKNPVAAGLQTLQGPVVGYVEGSLNQSLLDHLFYPSWQSTTLLDSVVTHLGVIGATYVLVEGSKKLDKLFMDKFYYLDTAMVPEIIYHEFSHVALSDELNPIHSVPVIEGMADYFATRIAKDEKMYKKLNNYSNNAQKNAKNKKLYHPAYELQNNAESDFTLGVLWSVKTRIDTENSKRPYIIADTDQLIYKSRMHLSSDSSILDLTNALKRSCIENNDTCFSRRLGVGALHQAIESKGF